MSYEKISPRLILENRRDLMGFPKSKRNNPPSFPLMAREQKFDEIQMCYPATGEVCCGNFSVCDGFPRNGASICLYDQAAAM